MIEYILFVFSMQCTSVACFLSCKTVCAGSLRLALCLNFLSMATGSVTVYCMCVLKVYERNESPLYILGLTYVSNGLKSVI